MVQRKQQHNIVEQDEHQKGVYNFKTSKPIPLQYTAVQIWDYFFARC